MTSSLIVKLSYQCQFIVVLLYSEKYKLLVIKNSHRDVKHSIGNKVNNVVIIVYDALEILKAALCKVYDGLTTLLFKLI